MSCSATRFVALGAFVLATNAVAPTLLAHPEPRGIWSLNAGTLYHEVHPLSRGAVSPDGRSAVRATATGLVVHSGAAQRTLPLQFTPGLAEVVWSPNARYVAVNASSGGAIGSWDTQVLSTAGAAPALDVRALVEARLGKGWACEGKEAINVGTVGWDRSGAELLVIAEVPPRAHCVDAGEIRGLQIHLGRKVVTQVLTAEAVRQSWWQMLGSRFRTLRSRSR